MKTMKLEFRVLDLFSNDVFKYYITNSGFIYRITIKSGKIKAIKYHRNFHGYRCVQHRGKKYLIHRLVYQYFIGEIPEGMTVDHIREGNKDNNRPENLQLLSRSDNTKKYQAYKRQIKEKLV